MRSPEPKLLESREDDKDKLAGGFGFGVCSCFLVASRAESTLQELLANSRAIEESATDATDSGGHTVWFRSPGNILQFSRPCSAHVRASSKQYKPTAQIEARLK